jgi:phage FluMu protein Com
MPTEEKPSRNEEEYFAKLNAELIKERRAMLDAARMKVDRTAHYMKCPKCGADLKEVEHHHVKVDRCPECKGVWIDAGEIELFEHASDNGVTKFFSSMFGRRHA